MLSPLVWIGNSDQKNNSAASPKPVNLLSQKSVSLTNLPVLYLAL